MDVFRIKDGGYETNLRLPRDLCHEKDFLSSPFLREAWNTLSEEQRSQLEVYIAISWHKFDSVIKRQKFLGFASKYSW